MSCEKERNPALVLLLETEHARNWSLTTSIGQACFLGLCPLAATPTITFCRAPKSLQPYQRWDPKEERSGGPCIIRETKSADPKSHI